MRISLQMELISISMGLRIQILIGMKGHKQVRTCTLKNNLKWLIDLVLLILINLEVEQFVTVLVKISLTLFLKIKMIKEDSLETKNKYFLQKILSIMIPMHQKVLVTTRQSDYQKFSPTKILRFKISVKKLFQSTIRFWIETIVQGIQTHRILSSLVLEKLTAMAGWWPTYSMMQREKRLLKEEIMIKNL